MNIDELIQSISEPKLRDQLANYIDEWKRNEDSLDDLCRLVGKWHGNVWFENQDAQNTFYQNWLSFKKEYIDCIGGMTVNERLYWFGLIDQWDKGNEKDQSRIRIKLKAKK